MKVRQNSHASCIFCPTDVITRPRVTSRHHSIMSWCHSIGTLMVHKVPWNGCNRSPPGTYGGNLVEITWFATHLGQANKVLSFAWFRGWITIEIACVKPGENNEKFMREHVVDIPRCARWVTFRTLETYRHDRYQYLDCYLIYWTFWWEPKFTKSC